jgi:hypothetical protein
VHATRYSNLRPFLAPAYRSLPDRTIERVVASQGLEAGAVEDIWDDIGNFVASALPTIGGAVGSVIAPGAGTAIGSTLGSLAGGALHSAIGPGQQPARPQFGTATPTAASSQQSAAQLLQLLMRPEFMQALIQMLLGAAGNSTVSVPTAPRPAAPVPATGASAVPVSAFTNLLATLATQASEAYNDERAAAPSAGAYHYGASPWGSAVDLASAESRAGALINLLHESAGGATAMAARQKRRQRLATFAQALRTVDSRSAAVRA